jgi:hypothetical protein
MTSTSTLIERLLPGSEVRAVDRLRSSDRTVVERVRLARPEAHAPSQVIMKRFVQFTGFATEAAALSVLPVGVPAPRLLAEDRIERVVIMTDVGSGPSLADALLADRAESAEAALCAWADTMAKIHEATSTVRASFSAALAERGGSSEQVDPMGRWLAASPRVIEGTGAGLVAPVGLREELTSMTAFLADPVWGAMSQGDSCPDNNILTPAGLHLIDFEGAAFRHVAWDLAYLRVPWPSCWCAWDLPAAAAATATGRYLRAVSRLPARADPSTLEDAVEVATLAFALIAAAWFLPSALQRDDTLGTPDLPAPSRRAAVLHRFDLAAATAAALDYPTTASAARSWTDTLRQRWGRRTLPTNPAFR